MVSGTPNPWVEQTALRLLRIFGLPLTSNVRPNNEKEMEVFSPEEHRVYDKKGSEAIIWIDGNEVRIARVGRSVRATDGSGGRDWGIHHCMKRLSRSRESAMSLMGALPAPRIADKVLGQVLFRESKRGQGPLLELRGSEVGIARMGRSDFATDGSGEA